jgi:hypothetical protein
MAIDYHEVLAELRAEETRLLAELNTVRASIPGIEILAKRQLRVSAPPMARFAGMGTKEAILRLLRGSERPLMPADIARLLMEGGIQTKSADFPSTVTSTLNQLKAENLVSRVEDGWQLGNGRRPLSKDFIVSHGAPNSLVETMTRPSSLTNES